MTLTKNQMIREVGRRTRLKNRDVQLMLESLIEVWITSLVREERIELENFLVLEVKKINRGNQPGKLFIHDKMSNAPQIIKKLSIRPSRYLRKQLRDKNT